MKKVIEWIKKNKTTTILVLIIVVLLFAVFGSRNTYSSYGYADMAKGLSTSGLAESAVRSSDSASTSQVIERQIIETGSIDMKVGSVDSTMSEIEGIAQKYDGYVSYSSSDRSSGYKTGYITVRVDHKNFATAMSEIALLGKVESKNSNSNDVTEQYIDLEAKLKNLKATEQRYVTLLDKATTVEDMLNIEEQLTSIRYRIDSAEGQKKYLDSQIQLSTITVNLHEQQPYVPEIDWSKTFSDAIGGFFGMIQEIIIIGLTLIPLVLVALALRFIYRKVQK